MAMIVYKIKWSYYIAKSKGQLPYFMLATPN